MGEALGLMPAASAFAQRIDEGRAQRAGAGVGHDPMMFNDDDDCVWPKVAGDRRKATANR
ncbi:MAG: hypothetical protein AAFZ01_06575 [Pseudomonadota bacterium]